MPSYVDVCKGEGHMGKCLGKQSLIELQAILSINLGFFLVVKITVV